MNRTPKEYERVIKTLADRLQKSQRKLISEGMDTVNDYQWDFLSIVKKSKAPIQETYDLLFLITAFHFGQISTAFGRECEKTLSQYGVSTLVFSELISQFRYDVQGDFNMAKSLFKKLNDKLRLGRRYDITLLRIRNTVY